MTTAAVIVSPPATKAEDMSPFPPVGPALIRAYLREHGHEIDIVDLTPRMRLHESRFNRRGPSTLRFADPEAVRQYLEGNGDPKIERLVNRMIELAGLDRYEIVGFSLIVRRCIPAALCMAKALKRRRRVNIVFGGPVLTRFNNSNALLEFPWVDVLVKGDGERAMLRIVSGKVEAKDGICLPRDGQVVSSAPGVISAATRPPPAFSEDDLVWYRRANPSGRMMLPYVWARGCRYKCAFCNDYSNAKFEYVRASKVVDDLEVLVARHGVRNFYFGESNIANDPQAVRELSDLLVKRDLRIKWGGLATLSMLDHDTLDRMARAGCKFLFLGVESGEPSILKRMKVMKNRDEHALKKTLAHAQSRGINLHLFFIVGFPHEQRDDVLRTKRAIRELAPYATTSMLQAFRLEETSAVELRPERFGLRLRKTPDSKYGFLRRPEYDEIDGLSFEQRQRLMRIQGIELGLAVLWHIRLPSMVRMAIRDPGYVWRKYTGRPYFTYDMHLAL